MVQCTAGRVSEWRAGPTATEDEDWWREAGPHLASLMAPERYPCASRIGEAAGQAYGSKVDPARARAFGLRTILNGIGSPPRSPTPNGSSRGRAVMRTN